VAWLQVRLTVNKLRNPLNPVRIARLWTYICTRDLSRKEEGHKVTEMWMEVNITCMDV
jgi:hypothetical protein